MIRDGQAPPESGPASRRETFRLGDWWVDPPEGVLRNRERETRLPPQPMQVLLYLASRPGRVVSKEELFAAVWEGVAVEEVGLARCISEIRKALGDDARVPRYIKTIPKRGYRLIAPVDGGAVEPAAGVRRRSPKRWAAGGAIALLLVLAAYEAARRWRAGAGRPAGGGPGAASAPIAAPAPPERAAGEPAWRRLAGRSPAPGARLYFGGVEKLRRFEAAAARDLLERSLAEDPHQPAALLYLAEALSLLGKLPEAAEVGARGVELAEDLPRDERLWIEAGWRALSSEWDRAADLYRGLWAASPNDPEIGLPLARALLESGRPEEALSTLDELRARSDPESPDPRLELLAADAQARRGDAESAVESARRAAALGEAGGADLVVARARLAQGFARLDLGAVDAALADLEAARSAFAAAGDRPGEAGARRRLAGWLLDRGDFAEAEAITNEALAISREAGDLPGEARSLKQLAGIRSEHGDMAAASELYERALATLRRIGDRDGEAGVLMWMGTLAGMAGDLDGAQPLFEQALALYRDLGDRNAAAMCLTNLGKVHLHRGEPEAAVERLRDAEAIVRESGQQSTLGNIQFNLGFANSQTGNLEAARDAFAGAVATFRAMDNRRMVAASLDGLGEILMMQDDLDGAQARTEEALGLRREMGEPSRIVRSLLSLARVHLERGELAQAERLGRVALGEAGDAELKALPAHSLLAAVLLAQGRAGPARQALARAEAELEEQRADEIGLLRLWLVSARVQAASGQGEAARLLLDEVQRRAEREGAWGVRAEARLALGEVEIALGEPAAAAARLQTLELEARARHWNLIARRARELQEGLRIAQRP